MPGICLTQILEYQCNTRPAWRGLGYCLHCHHQSCPISSWTFPILPHPIMFVMVRIWCRWPVPTQIWVRTLTGTDVSSNNEKRVAFLGSYGIWHFSPSDLLCHSRGLDHALLEIALWQTHFCSNKKKLKYLLGKNKRFFTLPMLLVYLAVSIFSPCKLRHSMDWWGKKTVDVADCVFSSKHHFPLIWNESRMKDNISDAWMPWLPVNNETCCLVDEWTMYIFGVEMQCFHLCIWLP